MYKKISVIGITLMASTSLAFAASPAQKSHSVNIYKGEVNYLASPPVIVPDNLFEPSPYLGISAGSRVNYASVPSVYTGLEGNIFAGYGGVVNDNFYLAGEIGFGNNITMTNYSGTNGSEKSTWNVAVSIIPGVLLTNDALLYLRAGLRTTDFTAPKVDSTTALAGVGMQVALSKEWDVRGEYVYGFYRNMSIGTPRSQQVNLGILYKFM